MTDKTDREIMQMALEALYSAPLDHNSIKSRFFERRHHAIIALRERLTQPEQEPVVWLSLDSCAHWFLPKPPQKREWQGLTDEEMRALADEHLKYQPESYEVSGVFDLIRAVEAKLKETK